MSSKIDHILELRDQTKSITGPSPFARYERVVLLKFARAFNWDLDAVDRSIMSQLAVAVEQQDRLAQSRLERQRNDISECRRMFPAAIDMLRSSTTKDPAMLRLQTDDAGVRSELDSMLDWAT